MAAKFDLNDDSVFVIIGSGAGGGTLGTELALKGIKTLILEAGARFEMDDFLNDEWDSFTQLAWTDMRTTSGSWRVAKDFSNLPAWIVKAVGGSTVHWAGASLRFQEHEFVLADLPGLIEGAAEGRGLGHRFLRHVERARVLVLMLDLSPLAEHTPREQERILLAELADYQPDLLDRPRVVVGSRADLAAPDVDFDGLRVAAVTQEGVRQLLGLMAEAVRAARAELPDPDAFVVHRPVAEGYRIERDDSGAFEVLGRQATRAVALSDLTNSEALDEAHRRLKSLGIDKALARAGAQPGDLVRIGRMVFTFDEDDVR